MTDNPGATQPSAKDLRIAPIGGRDANAFVRVHHYSGSVVSNSQLHLGAFLGTRLVGVLQFGPPLDRRKLLGLVAGTPWNGMMELNRAVFTDRAPRNSESRTLGVAFRLMRREYPHLQWVVSFADATQCGDGTIYRASGFVLTGINRNKTIWVGPDGSRTADLSLRESMMVSRVSLTSKGGAISRVTQTKAGHAVSTDGAASMKSFRAAGYKPAPGFQLRYVYFLDPTARDRLAVPVIPFERITELGAGMYRGVARGKQATAGRPPASGGAAPTPTLQADRAA